MGGRGPESQCWEMTFYYGIGLEQETWVTNGAIPVRICAMSFVGRSHKYPSPKVWLVCLLKEAERKPLWLEANDPGGRVVKRRLRGTWAGPWKASRHTLFSARMPRFPFYNTPQHPLTSSLKILQHLPTVGTMKCNLFSMAPQCWLHIRIPGTFLFK